MLDPTDTAIINALQGGFPISERPFRDAAHAIGLTENELIEHLSHLKEAGAITRFGPMFNAERMGGAFCLVAMAVPEERFDEVVSCINSRPEVAHNYQRCHTLNVWFVLATERPGRIKEVLAEIEAETGLDTFAFPKLEEFFIGFKVHV